MLDAQAILLAGNEEVLTSQRSPKKKLDSNASANADGAIEMNSSSAIDMRLKDGVAQTSTVAAPEAYPPQARSGGKRASGKTLAAGTGKMKGQKRGIRGKGRGRGRDISH